MDGQQMSNSEKKFFSLEDVVKEYLPQHQGSLADQLKELIPVATKLGLYDAADYLIIMTKRFESK